MTREPDLLGETLTSIANELPVGRHAQLTEQLMRRLHEKDQTLATLADPKIMNRSLYTLKKLARRFDLSFPDYVPRKLRKKDEAHAA